LSNQATSMYTCGHIYTLDIRVNKTEWLIYMYTATHKGNYD